MALDDVQHTRQSANVDVEGLGGHVPAGGHEDLSGEVVDFVGRGLGKGDFQRAVSRMSPYRTSILSWTGASQRMVPDSRRTRP